MKKGIHLEFVRTKELYVGKIVFDALNNIVREICESKDKTSHLKFWSHSLDRSPFHTAGEKSLKYLLIRDDQSLYDPIVVDYDKKPKLGDIFWYGVIGDLQVCESEEEQKYFKHNYKAGVCLEVTSVELTTLLNNWIKSRETLKVEIQTFHDHGVEGVILKYETNLPISNIVSLFTEAEDRFTDLRKCNYTLKAQSIKNPIAKIFNLKINDNDN